MRARDEIDRDRAAGATDAGVATRPGSGRRRRRRWRQLLVALAVLVLAAGGAGYWAVQHYFFDNPPAPPPLELTPLTDAPSSTRLLPQA